MANEAVSRMLADASDQLTAAKASVAYWEQVVLGLSGIMAMDAPATPVDKADDSKPGETQKPAGTEIDKKYPRSPEAVTAALRSRPNLPMRFPDVWNLIKSMGLADPSIKSGINAYQNAARRLAEDPNSPVQRDDQGRYVYRADNPAAAPQGASLRGLTGVTGMQPLEGFAS